MEGSGVEIILRAIQDERFRERLFQSKEEILRQYRLTDEERRSLIHLDRATFDKAVAQTPVEVRERLRRGGFELGQIRAAATLDYPVIEDFDAG